MKIGQLASRAGCSADAIRFYERRGLLRRAARSAGNQRMYGAEHLTTLRLIRRCRALGLPIAAVKMLVAAAENPGMDCGAVAAIFDGQIALIQARIAALQRVKRALAEARRGCPQPRASAQCGILRRLRTT